MQHQILYLSPNGYVGGAERFILNVTQAHLKRNIYRPIVVLLNEGPLKSLLQTAGIEVFVLSHRFKMSFPWTWPLAFYELRSFIKRRNIKLVHNTMAYAQIFSSLALLGMSEVEKVWFQHGPIDSLFDRIASLFRVSAICFNSSYLRDRHQKLYFDIGRSKSYVIPLGIECRREPWPQTKVDQKERLGLNPNATIITMMSRISPQKGIHLGVEALARISDLNERQIQLLIVGDPNSPHEKRYYDELKALAKRRGLESKVRWIQFQSDPEKIYAISDCFLHCACLPEAFGLVVAEAMLSNVFVIGSDLGGTKEILKHGQTGWVFDATSEQASFVLATYIKKFLETDSTELEQIRNNAREQIAQCYNIQVMVEAMETIYNQQVSPS